MLDADVPGTVDPEDRQIIEKLAKLHSMYSQVSGSRVLVAKLSWLLQRGAGGNADLHEKIGGLRCLLPERLINPAREALDNPGGNEPEKLATYLHTAAQAGSRDVARFKKDWHSDDVRGLWQTVNANDLPQGGDAWAFEYGSILQDAVSTEHTSSPADNAIHEFQPQTETDIGAVVDDFRVRHPELKIHVSAGATRLPIDITVAGIDLRIERSKTVGATEYNVIGKPGADASNLRDSILQGIRQSKDKLGLANILVSNATCLASCESTDNPVQEMVSSYHDIATRPCHKCHKLFDTKTLHLPMVRYLKSPQDRHHPHFLALHLDCK